MSMLRMYPVRMPWSIADIVRLVAFGRPGCNLLGGGITVAVGLSQGIEGDYMEDNRVCLNNK